MGTFEVGQRVRLLRDTEIFNDEYRDSTSIIKVGTLGTVIDTDDEASRYDEVPGPYRVRWDNGAEFACFVEWIAPAAAPGAEIKYAYFLWKDTGAVACVCDGDFIAQNRANPALIEVDAARWTRLAHEGERAWERVQAENAALVERVTALTAALEPFAEAWLQVPFGLRSTLRIWNGLIDEDSDNVSLGISTDTLQNAHTAFFELEPSPAKGEGE